MHPTTAWLIAFKRAFTASHTSPPPQDNHDLLNLLRAADERLVEGEHPDEGSEPCEGDGGPAPTSPQDTSRH